MTIWSLLRRIGIEVYSMAELEEVFEQIQKKESAQKGPEDIPARTSEPSPRAPMHTNERPMAVVASISMPGEFNLDHMIRKRK